MIARLCTTAFLIFAFSPCAQAARCGGDFNVFLSEMAREAQAQGVSRQVIDQAFAGLTPSAEVLNFDRRQRGTFRKSFEEYARTRVIPARIKRATSLMWARMTRGRGIGRADG